MPITLTTEFPISNGKRLVIIRARPDEDEQRMVIDVSLRTAVNGTPADSEIATQQIVITATKGDQIARGAPGAGGKLAGFLVLNREAVSSPTAFADAFAAYKTGKAALEAHLLAVGFIHPSLAGS